MSKELEKTENKKPGHYGKSHKTDAMKTDMQFFREHTLRQCRQYSPEWWKVISAWLTQEKDNEFKKIAVVEFNKLQIKALPTDLKIGPDGGVDVGVILLPKRKSDEERTIEIPEKKNYSPLTATADTLEVVEGEIAQ